MNQDSLPLADDASVPGNPYSERFRQQATHPDLDAAAPELRSSDLRRMNRRALGFLAGIVVLLAAAALWMFNTVLHRNDSQQKPREETVTIPAAPRPQLPPPPAPPAQRQAEAIAPPPLPALPPMPPAAPGPHQPSLMERRMMSAESAAAVGVGNGNARPSTPNGAPPAGPFGAPPASCRKTIRP